ncbi:ATP-binding cassette domain-containing protein [Eubacterium sp.]|uniref:ATP-binding cassette domain-containing protein n=1 Tax=Eubacterium sp. TaxID=142586 RepID=UPI0025ED9DAD|nr:ATP-binding cassette domain-containing protein [Eubacterium sp.]MCR5630047.1 ATP-binding cassette domain-containing protein [Eubacterium sp.]
MYSIEMKNIGKSYGDKVILKDFDLKVRKGVFLGIKGESGKGKTTLLNIIGTLESFEGEYKLNGEDVDFEDKKKKRKYLKDDIGYLFQNYALIDDLSVYDNLVIVLDKKDKENEKELLDNVLKKVGLDSSYLYKKIYTCSGGEQQRIAIARLMLKDCNIILADEPTGSLDEKNKEIVMNLICDLNREGKTVIMVSHDDEALSYCSDLMAL